MLSAFGIKAECDGVNLIVYGGKMTAGEVDSFNDHRIVMALAILATETGGEIEGADAVNKSFPDFFACIASVGIQIEEITP